MQVGSIREALHSVFNAALRENGLEQTTAESPSCLAGWFGQSKDGGQLAENLELDRLTAPVWVNDDVLNDLADAVEGPVPAFVSVRFSNLILSR
jgi:hypothetical protein